MALIKRDGTLNYDDPEYMPPDPTATKLPQIPGTGPAQVTTRDALTPQVPSAGDPPQTALPPPPATNTTQYPNAVVDDGSGGRENAAYQAAWGQSGNDVQKYIQSTIASNNLTAKQEDPTSLNPLLKALEAVGQPATLDQRSDGMHKGLYLNGDPKKFVKLLDGNNNWIYDTSGTDGNPQTQPGTPENPLNGILQQLLEQGKASAADTASQRASLSGRVNSLLDKYSQPVSASDPGISGMVDAYHGTNARALADYKEQAAERAHAEGVPSGAFDAQIGNATMAAGRAEGGLQTQLMSQELQSRRAALSDMINQSGGLMSAADKMSIQQEMDSIDGLIKGQELGLQGTQINNQNTQFYDKLSSDMGNNTNLSDQLITALLAGRPPA